ncbi:hypothetical protein AMD00_10820 [Viridibacillus arvi]|uniref:Uncharacterized protein n=1 Tax=Viridibacillus arvi TaxID=263475 RepID=A0A0M0LDU8_9BACL|nr:hypothetical protein AMD00_10820 [Viridibacillus arvi]
MGGTTGIIHTRPFMRDECVFLFLKLNIECNDKDTSNSNRFTEREGKAENFLMQMNYLPPWSSIGEKE